MKFPPQYAQKRSPLFGIISNEGISGNHSGASLKAPSCEGSDPGDSNVPEFFFAIFRNRALCLRTKGVAIPEAGSQVPRAPPSQPYASSCGRNGCHATAVTLSESPYGGADSGNPSQPGGSRALNRLCTLRPGSSERRRCKILHRFRHRLGFVAVQWKLQAALNQ